MIISVDIGGTKIAVALVDGNQILGRRMAVSPLHSSFAEIPNVVANLCRDWLQLCDSMAIATVGQVEGDCVHLASVQGRPTLALADEIEVRCGVRPVVLNDAWAGALGEYVHGKLEKFETVIYVTVSTGIGAGIIHNGQLLTSHNGLMAHLGHMSVGRGGAAALKCNCGRSNCVDATCLHIVQSPQRTGHRVVRNDTKPAHRSLECSHSRRASAGAIERHPDNLEERTKSLLLRPSSHIITRFREIP